MTEKIVAQCKTKGCIRPQEIEVRGLCRKCNMQDRRDKGLVKHRPSYYEGLQCSVQNCIAGVTKKALSLCAKHYDRLRQYGDPLLSKNNCGNGNDAAERFWSRVEKRGDDECWEWGGLCNDRGYGSAQYTISTLNVSLRGAHRIAYYLATKMIPKQMILHSCDNPSCVNPNHLRDGSHRENMADRDARNRTLRGERNPWSKLKDADVPTIRSRYISGTPYSQIAADYGVNLTTIRIL